MMQTLKRFWLWLKRLDDASKNWTKPGGWSDATTYAGNAKAFIVGLACFVAALHLDDFGRWLYRLFGSELIQSPGNEGTHFIVFTVIGVVLCTMSVIHIWIIYRSRHLKK